MKPLTQKLSQDVKTEQPSVQSEYWDTGLGAVGCIFVAKSTGKILLSYRSGMVDEPHEWGTWGGKIDEGENKLQALAREIEEETGYTGHYKLFKLWTFEDPSEDFVYYNYLALVDDEFTPERSAESERGKWVEWGEWPHPIHFGLEALLQNSGDEIHRVITLIKRKQADILEVMDTPPAIVHPASTNATANYNVTNAMIVAVTLYGEAGHEGHQGLQAVMNVIMNRAKGDFKKAKDIVLSPKQFSMWNSVTNAPEYALEFARLYAKEDTFRDAIRIVDLAQTGKLPDITGGATFYFNPKKANPSWAKKMKKTVTIGNHDFYKPIPKRKMKKGKVPTAIREMIESQNPYQAVLFKKGIAGDGIWEYELKSPHSYLRYRHEPDTKTFYLDNIGTPNEGDKNKGYAKALLETFFQLIKGQGGALDSGPYTTSGTAYVKHVVERLSKQYGVRLVKGRDAIDEARFPAVKTKDGRVFVGRIHADAVSKTGDADLESVGWWDSGTYYPEEEARKKWGAASTDVLEPELKRAWRLSQKVPEIGDDPVNLTESKLNFSVEAKNVPPEEVKKAMQLLYRFFKERDTLSWLKSNKWILTSVKNGHTWIDGERYEFEYIPVKGKEVTRKPFDGLDYTRKMKMFRTPKDAIDYMTANEKKHEGHYAFRGMNMAEWVDAQKQGYIKSKAEYNLGGVSQTYYGSNWSTAHSYAGGFAPFDKEPTRSLPGVIVAVPFELTKDAKAETGKGSHEERVAGKIPLDQVKGVWYIVPIEVGRGSMELVLKDGNLDRGSASPPSAKFVIVPKSGISKDLNEAYGDPGDHVVFGGVFWPDRVVADVVKSHNSYFGHTHQHGPTRWSYYQGIRTVFWKNYPPAVPEWEIVVKNWLEKRGYKVDKQTDKENYYKIMQWYHDRGLLKESKLLMEAITDEQAKAANKSPCFKRRFEPQVSLQKQTIKVAKSEKVL